MLAPADQVPALGSKRSTLASGSPLLPPTTTTVAPTSVAVWATRSMAMVPAALHTPVPGSNSSADDWNAVPSSPPVTSTRPEGSSTAA